MKAKVFIVALTTIVIAACSKDKFNTTPQLKFKSVNLTELQRGQSIIFKLDLTDKEGDVVGNTDENNDSLLTVLKVTRNCEASNTKSYYELPVVPETKSFEGEIEVRFSYSEGPFPLLSDPQCPNRNDSCVFKFVVKDRAGNVSDTAVSPEIVLIKN